MAESSHPFKRGNETYLTYRLKWAAWEWLYTVTHCRCVGMEVRLEGPGGRIVDLVGVGPENTVYIIEVKSSRSDFARDNHTPEEFVSLQAKAVLLARRSQIGQQTLSQATAYAQQTEPQAWEETFPYRQALADCERLVREQEIYQTRLATYSVKFHDRRFLGIADYHYIMAPRRVIPRRMLPPQWGLLNEAPAVVAPAPPKDIRKNTGIVSNILRAIARSNTTSMMRAQGVMFTEDGPVFPEDISIPSRNGTTPNPE